MALLQLQNPGFEDPIALTPAATANQPTVDLSQSALDGSFTFLFPVDFTPYINDSIPGWEIFDPEGLLDGETNRLPDADGYESISSVGIINPTTPSFDLIHAGDDGAVPEGQNSLYTYTIEQPGSTAAGFGVRQVLQDVLEANTLYELNVSVGDPNADPTYPLAGFPGYRIELRAGGNLLSVDNNSQVIQEGTFKNITLSYLAESDDAHLGEQLEVRLIGPAVTPGIEVHFDDVSLSATSVPEPAPTLGLVALLGGLALIRWMRKAVASH